MKVGVSVVIILLVGGGPFYNKEKTSTDPFRGPLKLVESIWLVLLFSVERKFVAKRTCGK